MKNKINFETDELNYLFGGYFSAIGRIHISKVKSWYTLRCAISFDDLKILKLFQKEFGGDFHLYLPMPSSWAGRKIRRKYRLTLHDSYNTLCFIEAIEPYIIDKKLKKKMQIAKKFIRYQQNNYYQKSDKVRKQKHKYYLQMRRAK